MGDDEDVERRNKKKSQSKYNYTFGDTYPGVKIGHKTCERLLRPGYLVPARMGWLWNVDAPGRKVIRGWTPGAIGKSVKQLMVFKCPQTGRDTDKKKKKKKRGQTVGGGGGGDSEPEEPLEPKPALKVQRKGDTFTIAVNPLKDLTKLELNEDPYVDCDPIVFKIIKKRSPEEQAKVEARRLITLKRQRDSEIRKALSEAVEDICKCAYMDVYCNDLTAIDKVIDSCPAFKEPECICKEESLSSLSSCATWDIEYTPPFGCFDLAPRKNVTYISVDTQCVPADLGIQEKMKCNKKGNEPTKCKRSCQSVRGNKNCPKKTCRRCCRRS